MSGSTDAVVIGGGPAGLAAAAAMAQRGMRAVVLERGAAVGEGWRRRYDSLRLNTSRSRSHLPGLKLGRDLPRYPTRDQLASYLERYAAHHRLDVRCGVAVERVEPGEAGWQAVAASGERHGAPVAVVATGGERVPEIPAWPGRDDFAGELLHSSEYRSAAPFAGRDVVVAGGGASGGEIAHDLAAGGAGRVLLSIRTPANVALREVNGIPGDLLAPPLERVPLRWADAIARVGTRAGVGDLSAYGLPSPARGMYTRAVVDRRSPMVVDAAAIELIRARRIEIVPALAGFDGRDVLFAGGRCEHADAVVAATGFRTGLEPLVGHLGVLDAQGFPTATGASAPAGAQGLHFIGFDPRLSGTLRRIRQEALALARALSSRRAP